MTAVCGYIASDGTVWVAADSRAADDGGNAHQLMFPKAAVIDVPGSPTVAVVGSSGAPRLQQILVHRWEPPPRAADMTPAGWAFAAAESIRDLTREDKHLTDDDGDLEGWLLIGYDGHLFTVDPWYTVHEDARRYTAIGSGHAYAKGALSVLLTGTRFDLADGAGLLTAALEAAVEHNTGVAPPFTVLSAAAGPQP